MSVVHMTIACQASLSEPRYRFAIDCSSVAYAQWLASRTHTDALGCGSGPQAEANE